MGGLAWIMNCIRSLADGIEVMGFAGLGGVENDKTTRINWSAASPWSLQFAIRGGQHLSCFQLESYS